MSKKVYDKDGNSIVLLEQGDVEDYIHKEYDVYDMYDGLTNPVEGFKKIYSMLPNGGTKPLFIWIGAGSQFLAIVQKTDNEYGSAIIFGYGGYICYVQKIKDTWNEKYL